MDAKLRFTATEVRRGKGAEYGEEQTMGAGAFHAPYNLIPNP